MAPNTHSRNQKPIVKVAIAGFLLATLFCMLRGVAAQECFLFHNLAWVALEVVRPAVSAVWESALANLCERSTLLHHLLEIVASDWPLLWVIAG
jgi:hypothetical protein